MDVPLPKPRTADLGGVRAIFEHRDDQDVDIEPDCHLICVNFQVQRDATYRYAGAPAWRGTREMGMAHLIEPRHRITGFVREPTDHVVLMLGRDWMAELAQRSLDVGRVELVSDGTPYRDAPLHSLALLMRDELAGAVDPLMVDALATAAGIHLLRTASDARPRPIERRSALPPRALARVFDAIEAGLADGTRLDGLARLVELSPDHLWRCFRAETGLTPHQYQTQRRVERVKALLGEPAVSLADASLRAGFSSQSHMTRAFRRAVGTTPARYRRARR